MASTENPALAENVIQPDATDDSPSDYYSDAASDLTSLTSGVTNYVYENGRRYHSYREGKYVLPNDETEMDRLDLVHHLFRLVMQGSLHLAPLRNPQSILDLGTGTGIWAIDIADLYPSAEVIGDDLSPIQPRFVAPNVQFIIEDFEETWAYPENKFDYIHGRTLLGAAKNWPELFAKAYKHLKPGGYLEFQEGSLWVESDDGTLKEDSAVFDYFHLLRDQSAKAGLDLDILDKLEPWMSEAGFVDVELKVFKVPWGPWPKDRKLKEIGRVQFHNLMEAFDSYGLALLTRGSGFSEEQAKIYLALVKSEVRKKEVHSYNKVYVVTGKKPEKAGEPPNI